MKDSLMASKGQSTGMLGVYLTAVELARRDYIVSPTSRSAIGADLLVTDQECRKAWSVQVKANAKAAPFWLLSAKAVGLWSQSHVYVFVNAANDPQSVPQFYIVPSEIVSPNIVRTVSSTGTVWYEYRKDETYKDKWEIFGNPFSGGAAR